MTPTLGPAEDVADTSRMASRYSMKPFVVAAIAAFAGGLIAGLIASCAPAADEPVGAGDDPVPGEGEGEPTAHDLAVATLDALLVDALDRLPTPGISACVVKDGAVAWCGAAGLARIDEDVPVTTDTPFLLASTSKTVTAAAAMQLVESGAIALDDAVPFVHPQHGAFTWRMLLTHTASIVDNWDAMYSFYFYGTDPEISLGSAVHGYFEPGGEWYDADANFSPAPLGTRYEYANMGIALAGFLVEDATGVDFAEYTRDDILRPLGMTNSSWRLADYDDVSALAMPYDTGGFGQWVADGDVTYSDYPDGGLRSSANDLARWLACITRGGELDGVRVLSEQSVQTMLSPAAPSVDASQGVVFYSFPWLGDTWWGHGGDETGVATDMYFRESDGLGFLVLMNAARNDSALVPLEESIVAAAADL